MDQHSYTLYSRLQDLVNAHIIPVLEQKLHDQISLLKEVGSQFENYVSKIQTQENSLDILGLLRNMMALKESITILVNEGTSLTDELTPDELFSEYFTALAAFTEKLPELKWETQKPERFQVLPGDRLFIGLRKRFKHTAWNIGLIPTRVSNRWRKIRGKEVEPLAYWKHAVPEKTLVIWFFRDRLLQELDKTMGLVFRQIATSSDAVWQIESKMDHDFAEVIARNPGSSISAPGIEFQAGLEKNVAEIRSGLDTLIKLVNSTFDQVFEEYIDHFEKVGTLELPLSSFHPTKVERHHLRTRKAYRKSIEGWSNTIKVLNDNYNLDQELYQLRYANLEQYFFTAQKLDLKINEKIAAALDELSGYIISKKSDLQAVDNQPEALSKVIKQVKYDLGKYLNQKIPKASKLLFDQNIPALIDNLEVRIKNQVNQLSSTRAVAKEISYERPIQNSEIDYISPRELIAFEALPTFLTEVKSLKSELVRSLDQAQHSLTEISQICDFNLATSLAALEEELDEEKPPKELALEGLDRAASRLEDIGKNLSELGRETDDKLKQGVAKFNLGLLALNKIETVFDIKVRIAKAKAVEKTKALRDRVTSYYQLKFPELVQQGKKRWLKLHKYYQETSQKYGLAGPSQPLSAEVSTFLSETDAAIDQLPFVYQRLFEIAPLENENFYEPRANEIKQLARSYQNWEKQHFSATALIGETGSGTTTLTNFFLEQEKPKFPVVRAHFQKQIYRTDDFLAYFGQLFNAPSIDSLDHLVEHLNNLRGKRIMVLENLQHYYLRRVNGFECLNLLFELISRTNQNIFWLVTINLHAYNYLIKTSAIEDFFAYNIFLEPLKDEQITEIVLRRHRVSGYNIQFKPGKLDRMSKKFKKMAEPGRQQYLKKEFFSGLNKMANSNISLALIYWLRSTHKVEGDTITIGSLKDLDFSFLANLSSDKLFTLHALLLHDGLNMADYAKVFLQTGEQSKLLLILLFEDGIIVKHEDRYFINPLLFRQVVNLLKSKNILH